MIFLEDIILPYYLIYLILLVVSFLFEGCVFLSSDVAQEEKLCQESSLID